ncbi:hypothetical protein IU487_33685 [Nocardia puris]|uniref:hypothetical protein n=1 Tax=Nocardia puris TaxID=208602 RepID=UPI0018958A0D|nr:hypothetical protein [Nocardia puris]MBF6215953.1 hypothetical protein [Nocardia puris]
MTNSSDPVQEASSTVHRTAWQAFQTAATVTGLLQRRAGEARTLLEHGQRMDTAAAREMREQQIHGLKVAGYEARADDSARLTTARVEEISDRREHARRLADLDGEVKQALRARFDTERERRVAESEAAIERGGEIHELQKAGYLGRERRAEALFRLDEIDKQWRIFLRLRGAGIGDGLGEDTDLSEAQRWVAAFAAAQATGPLSEDHQRAADAFGERFTDDTGLNLDDLADPVTEPAPPPPDPDPGVGPDGGVGEPESAAVEEDPMRDLIVELVMAGFLDYVNGPATDDTATSADEAAHTIDGQVESVVWDTGLDEGTVPDPGGAAPGSTPGPEVAP